MANFLPLSPPLGHHYFLAFGGFPSAPVVHTQPTTLIIPIDDADLSYPPLSASNRVLLLMKYPGTILADPDKENVVPYPALDRAHVDEIWAKYDHTLGDSHIYADLPCTNLAVFAEREIAEWVAEYKSLHSPTILVMAELPIIKLLKSESRKRDHGNAFKDDASVRKKESRALKKVKKIKQGASTTAITHNKPTVKDQYDAAFPADVVVDEGSPAYIMALNYLKAYARSDAEYSRSVKEIIAKQGIDPIAQRCAKFFAWALKQAIHSLKVEPIEAVPEPAVAEPAVAKPAVAEESEFEDELENSDYEEVDLGEDSDDEIINFRPRQEKPVIKKVQVSTLRERLGAFLPEMEAANAELAVGVQAGHTTSMELSDSDDEHIAMEVGLGVLEEVRGEELLTERV